MAPIVAAAVARYLISFYCVSSAAFFSVTPLPFSQQIPSPARRFGDLVVSALSFGRDGSDGEINHLHEESEGLCDLVFVHRAL